MLLFELENAMIKPLSRADKFQLLLDITRMLQDEERSETSIRSGVEYPVFTPTIAPDDRAYQAAYQLQQLWEGQIA